MSVFEIRRKIILDCANRLHMRKLIALAVAAIGFFSTIALPTMLISAYKPEKTVVLFMYIGIGVGLSAGFAILLASMLDSESSNYYPRLAKLIYGSLVAEKDPAGAKLDLEYLVTNESFRASMALKYAVVCGYRVTLDRIPIDMVENCTVKNSAMPYYDLIKFGTPGGVLNMGPVKFYTTLQDQNWMIRTQNGSSYIPLDQYMKQYWKEIAEYMENIILQSYLGHAVNASYF